VSPSSVHLTCHPGETTNTQVTARNPGASYAVTWQTSQVPTWLTLSPNWGQLFPASSQTITLSANAAGLGAGTYTANLVFTAGPATYPLSVTLDVTCPCNSGPCCDGCGFRPASTLCQSHVQTQYGCDSSSCGGNVTVRYQDQYCSGSAAACDGSSTWTGSQIVDSCSSTEKCVAGNPTCQSDASCCPYAACNGVCCSYGQVCHGTSCCTPQTCSQLGKACGTWDNGCGQNITCPSCIYPDVCNTSTGQCVTSCTPQTCSQLGKECGTWDNGCGQSITCPSCAYPEVCDNTTGQCGTSCIPQTCSQLGKECGTWDNGCDQTVTCPSCTSPETCNYSTGQCQVTGCTPDCGLRTCGPSPNSCNGADACGRCLGNNSCNPAGDCVSGCTPKSCQAQGRTCGSAQDGCGHQLECGTCPGSHTCSSAGHCQCNGVNCEAGGDEITGGCACQTNEAAVSLWFGGGLFLLAVLRRRSRSA
jgi:hypothetical protein